MIHEIGHVIGLWHEQSREDRDAFVTINFSKVQPGAVHNFNQHITDGDDVGAYDYGSIMHYPRDAFSIDGSDTITPTDPAAVIGQRTALSAGDIAAANSVCPLIKLPKEHIKDIRLDTRKELVKDIRLDTRKEIVLDTLKEMVKDRIKEGPLDPPFTKRFDPVITPGPIVQPVGPIGPIGPVGSVPFAVATPHQAPELSGRSSRRAAGDRRRPRRAVAGDRRSARTARGATRSAAGAVRRAAGASAAGARRPRPDSGPVGVRGVVIVAVSHPDDPHAQRVLGHLEDAGHEAVLLDLSDLPDRATLTVDYDHGSPRIEIGRDDGSTIDLTQATAVWWRRPQAAEPSSVSDLEVRLFTVNEWHEAINGLWQLLDVHWVNDPVRDEVAARKALQLRVAARTGLRVPRTIITSDPQQARAFVEAEGVGNTVFKTFSCTHAIWRETRLVREDVLSLLEAVRLAPVIFQEYIPAGVDLRVTAVGERLFPAAIHSEETDYPVDFRMVLGQARTERRSRPGRPRAAAAVTDGSSWGSSTERSTCAALRRASTCSWR